MDSESKCPKETTLAVPLPKYNELLELTGKLTDELRSENAQLAARNAELEARWGNLRERLLARSRLESRAVATHAYIRCVELMDELTRPAEQGDKTA
jgi:predicted nuclease with TOPRIM domain